MRSDVHAKALRAAAKVAFSVAFLGGCSAADKDTTEAVAEGDLAATESSVTSDGKKECADAAPAKPDCASVLNTAFADAGAFEWRPNPGAPNANVSKEVTACCRQGLLSSMTAETPDESFFKFRWACCSTVGFGGDHAMVMACTPWGPPVPPAMKRRVAPDPKPETWVGVA